MSEAKIRIVVDGRDVIVHAGTSVAAALLGAGVLAMRRSVSGEARGPLCGMGICYECQVTIDGVPHQRACLASARDGLSVITLSVPRV